MKKFNRFFKFFWRESIKVKLVQIHWNICILEKQDKPKENETEKIENALKIYYKEILYLEKYVNLNLKSLYHVIRSYKNKLIKLKTYN